jgi:oligo-1,6-glucosidase
MTNFPFTSIGQCRDIETLNFWNEAITERGWTPEQALQSIRTKGRDNARTPMQWTAEPGAGFTQGTPWLAVNPNHATLNLAAQADDAASVLHFHRCLVALRKAHPALAAGRFEPLLPDHPQVFACLRSAADGERLLAVCNVSAEPADAAWPDGLGMAGAELLLSVHGDLPGALPGSLPDALNHARLRPWEGLLLRLPPA